MSKRKSKDCMDDCTGQGNDDIQSACGEIPETVAEELISFLSSSIFWGVGRVTACSIVTYFGARVVYILDKDPKALRLAPGVGKFRMRVVIAGWNRQKNIRILYGDYSSNTEKRFS